MIFVTVGTSFPFDRLVEAVDRLARIGIIDDDVFAQIGIGGYRPSGFVSKEILEKQEFDECFRNANAVIGHAGMGTISMALELSKPLLVMPRLKKHGELVNGHQDATARHFAKLGHVLAAYDVHELSERVAQLRTFTPAPRICHAEAVSTTVAQFIEDRLGKSRDSGWCTT